MEEMPQTNEQLRLDNLKRLARVVFDLIDHEESRYRLELLCDLVAKVKPLLDEEERELSPDLGLELLEFVQLKDDTLAFDAREEDGLAEGTAKSRQAALDILNRIAS